MCSRNTRPTEFFVASLGDNPFVVDSTAAAVTVTPNSKKAKDDKENYNVKQSKIAIGSGACWGRVSQRHANTGRICSWTTYRFYLYIARGEFWVYWQHGADVAVPVLLLRIVNIAERHGSTFSRVALMPWPASYFSCGPSIFVWRSGWLRLSGSHSL